MKNKKRPLLSEFDKFTFANVSSATECTGLVTHMPTEEDMEAYREVYDFEASPIVSDEECRQIKEGKKIF
jgi:hypothetical protein